MPFLSQKARDIALALTRVAVYMRRTALRQRFEWLSMELLETVSRKDMESLIGVLESIQMFTGFAKDIYELEAGNAALLVREVSALQAGLKRSVGFRKNPSLEDIFGSEEEREGEFSEPQKTIDGPVSGNGGANGNGINATIRQSAIIDKIRQSGKVALKDVIAEFPEVSERTLRYDLNKLCLQDEIERIGNGGPSTYYVMKA